MSTHSCCTQLDARVPVQAFEATSAKDWLDFARRAEDVGSAALFSTDHYFGPGGDP